MTRVFLAAGVAALAITAPATAGPHGDRGGRGGQTVQARQGGGGQRAAQMQAPRAQRQQMAAPRAQRQQMAAPRMERAQRMAAPRMERAQRMTAIERPQRAQRMQMRPDRQQARAERVRPAQMQRQQAQTQRSARVDRQQVRGQRQANNAQSMRVDRQQLRGNRPANAQSMQAQRQQLRGDRQAQVMQRQQLRGDRQAQAQMMQGQRQQLRGERVQLRADNVARVQALAANRASFRPAVSYGTRVIPFNTAQTLLGVPLATATTFAALSPLPQTVQYLYPDTPNYYYRYGDGYMYQVDRGSNLIAALLPLLGGGYMPGSYLPSAYMSSYVPDYYGYNSFYPSSYGAGYGYGYDNLCNRYVNGVIYQVDCYSGMVQDVIPTYAGGYGVGQLLPTDYSYYNVPDQYRSMYYDTSDAGYWYAPGAIYQYDRSSSLITSVAALLSPGFSVGQRLPLGYSTYNVPYAYRTAYYDTPNAWYRYNNGYIYQVDPTTQLVSAVVASILT